MPRELRKRKAPALEPVALEPKPPTKRKKKGAVVEASVTKSPSPSPTPSPSPKPAKAKARATRESKSTTVVSIGQTISLDEFGGEIETNEGAKTTLAKLLDASDGGVVLFTYPKASTPGCTKQACLFRDRYTALTATGFAIYGLSRDSPKANSTFQTKQSLPYPLLCDPKATLITAIGMKKAPAGTKRGVFVVDKSGKVLAVETGGPGATVDVVQNLVDNTSVDDSPDEQSDAAPEK